MNRRINKTMAAQQQPIPKPAPLYIDIMRDGRFLYQLRYPKRGFPVMTSDGRIVEQYNFADIEAFVYEKRPSLRDKNIKILLSNQRA